jgi:hypothetical protein
MKNYATSRFAAAAALLTIYGCSDSGTPPLPGVGGGGSASVGNAGTGTLGGGGQTTAGSGTGTAGSSGATTGGSAVGGSAMGGSATGGTGGAAAGNGGTGGAAAGGMAGGSGGQAGGTGGTSGDGWVSILPKDEQLTGWFPYVKGYTPGMDPLKTFRRDPATGALMVTYQDYPNDSFDNHLGLIYYDKKLTNYKVRFEYSFQEPQAKNPVSWGKNNTGIFVFGTDPHQITGNPDFPTAIEIQILGKPSAGGSVNGQICLNSTVGMYPAMIGTKAINAAGGCFASTQNANDLQAAATWTTVEVEVDGSATGVTKIYQYKDGMKPATPIQTFTGPVKTGGQTVNSGWLSFQSESQPCTFRKIDLMELP